MVLCSQLQSISVFCIVLRNYWFGLDKSFNFVYDVALCSHLQCFQIFFTFLHFSEELLVFIKHWFLFMLWHSAASCKFPNFLSFWHFSQELLVSSWSSFDFCLCCGTLQPIIKFQNFLTFCIFLNYWSSSNFDFCSCCGFLQPGAKFHNFLSFWHFFPGTTGLIFIKYSFLFMLWHSATRCKVSKFSQFLAFFPGTTAFILIKLWFLFMLWHSAVTWNVSKFSLLFCIFLRNYWFDLDQTLIFVYALALYSQL